MDLITSRNRSSSSCERPHSAFASLLSSMSGCARGRRLRGGSSLFIENGIRNHSLEIVQGFHFIHSILTWPNGVVDAEEEDHVVVWNDLHHFHRPQRNCQYCCIDLKFELWRFLSLTNVLLMEKDPFLLRMLNPFHDVAMNHGPLDRELHMKGSISY